MTEATAGPVAVRDATAHDRPAIAAILAANDEPVDWPGLPDWPYLDHLLARGRAVVAVRDGRVAGFGATIHVAAITHVSDLFVDPEQHGGGIGRALMDGLLGNGTPGGRTWTTFSSADQRALALYLRAGLRPWWPNLYLIAGAPIAGRAAGSAGAAGNIRAEAVDLEAAPAIERSLSGLDRADEYRFWSTLPGAVALAAIDAAGRPAAIGIATGMRSTAGLWLKHLAMDRAIDDREAAAAVGAVVATMAARVGGGAMIGLCLPGPHPASAILLDAGFRIFDRDMFCSTDPAAIDPTRDVPDASFL